MQLMRSGLAMAMVFWLATMGATAQAAEAAKAALFVNLTSVDPHRVEMALAFTEVAAKRGHPVTLFLNIDAVRIAEKDSATFAPSRSQLESAMKAGARVIACPHCLHHAGLGAADLITGVEEGKPDRTMGALFAPDTRVMTW